MKYTRTCPVCGLTMTAATVLVLALKDHEHLANCKPTKERKS